jgi:hypothetical protein
MARWESSLEEFYDLLANLETILKGKRLLKDCDGYMKWPRRGVYFFFEAGEVRRSKPHLPRVVRVGTQAVSNGSRSTLWERLRTHRGTNQGTGNHRASVFRRHIGQALIAKSKGAISVPTWIDKQNVPHTVREAEKELERKVSDYIGTMPFLWVEVGDTPGPQSDRAVIETNSIILLAGSDGRTPVDPPSKHWLGNYSNHDKIRHSGLWNLDHVAEPAKPLAYDPVFLQVLAKYVEAMRTQSNS